MDNIEIDGLCFEKMIDYDQIQKRIRLIGLDINVQFENKHPVFIGVLNGSFMFMADLMKQIHIPCEMSFIKLASYSGRFNGAISELIGVGMSLKGRHVIIVEDIVDTGHSLDYTIKVLQDMEVQEITVATLLMKPSCLEFIFDDIKYVGFEIDKEFVVGYGLDYNGQCRNLPHIYKNVSSNEHLENHS